MIAVLARERDEAARALIDRWRPFDAALLSPRDLSYQGWRHLPDKPLEGRAVISGTIVGVGEIRAVVTLLDAVRDYDLPHIVGADRAYVASEMRAFLLSWLETLPCKMLNRPTPTSLTGCAWGAERWGLTAAELGIPTVPMSGSRDSTSEPRGTVDVTYVCGETLDAPTSRVASWVAQLASAANVGTLVARFHEGLRPRLAAVSVVPDLSRAEVADAALRWLDPVAA